MADPITLAVLIAIVTKNAPSWLAALGGTILDKGRETAIDKGKEFAVGRGEGLVRRVLHLDEKEQLRHLEQALKNAIERGLAGFDGIEKRDRYKDILRTLSLPGPQGEGLRQEIMQFFSLSETPDFAVLSDIYNRRQRLHDAAHQNIDVAPYLNSFFSALLGELYSDPYFRLQLSEVLQLRAAQSMQQSLLDIVEVLKRIDETLEESYTAEEFACDVAVYTAHIERTLHNLKIVGIVPKDQNSDPELSGIFVPLRIGSNMQTVDEFLLQTADEQTSDEQQPDGIVAALERFPYLVLLGGPGSGKSTATKHLAWSHAAANQSTLAPNHAPLLSGHPLPLRIELRRLSEERRRANYDFLAYVAEVLLKREGVEINPQMFKELLTRRCMLLLFDGLDEVATLDERLGLVREIENFALCYPGNRVLVTSRPVGYDLARISHPLFSHTEVQSFNDEQIQQFLENWYTAVLRLSPIPQREREEMDLLLTTLRGNQRLHKLAENPLLLTVITVLHRYERLPDKRVQVYDRCADLLLETWARLRGTDKRWEDMKMGKEDQYACVAYLAFVLHERSQEEASNDDDEEAEGETVDVSSRFLRQSVEDFLRKRKLINGVLEQRKEASRFISLIQEEAGLIVERGSDENGEALYSFVHQTFQEYFAAADAYERYQQKEDPKVISKFLVEHLHDPHWREVIFLLLGKLKSTPVTNQLRQILQGKTKSRRSLYTDIVQQDLFFICDCLLEEIKVENTLVDMVRSHLSKVVKESPFPEQRQEALKYLGRLMQTRQYAGQGSKELLALATKDDSLDIVTRIEVVLALYQYSAASSEERKLASQTLATLLKRPELSIEQVRQTAQSLYENNPAESEAEQLAVSMLVTVLKRPELSIEQIWQTAQFLYERSFVGLGANELAASILVEVLKRPELSIEQIRQVAVSLYGSSPAESEAGELAVSTLVEVLKRPGLSIVQRWQTVQTLYGSCPIRSEAELFAVSMMLTLLSRSKEAHQEDVYGILQGMVPQFHKLPTIDKDS